VPALAVALFTLCCLTPRSSRSQDLWADDFFRMRGPNGLIESLASYAGGIAAGGRFTRIGASLDARHVAYWDGTVWQRLGDGLDSGPRVLFEHAGALLAGDSAQVRSWDGQAWAPFGAHQGQGNLTLAFTVHQGQLLASFKNLGVKRWTGSSWATLGAVSPGGWVSDFVEFGGSLVACGQFTEIGGVAANSVATWNGVSWEPLGRGVTGGTATDAAVYEGDLVLSGGFRTAGERVVSGLARWDGATWSPMGEGYARHLVVRNGELWAVRGGRVVRWSGVFWQAMTFDYSSPVVAMHEDRLFASYDVSMTLPTEPYDLCEVGGERLSPVDGAGLETAGAFIVYRDSLLVSSYSGRERAFRKWIGTGWEVRIPMPSGVQCAGIFAGEPVVAGELQTGVGVPFTVGRWSGTAWEPLGGQLRYRSSEGDVRPALITRLIEFQGALHAAGLIGIPGIEPGGVVRWNGSSWEGLGAGLDVESRPDIALHHGELVATGGGIRAWNGTGWRNLGLDYTTDNRTRLVSYEGELYGTFISTVRGTMRFARFDGTFWVGIATPVPSTQLALETYGDKLVHGDYTWDRTSWSRLGSGINNTIADLIEHRGSLWASGSFTKAGGKPSIHVARWDGGPTPVVVQDLEAHAGSNGVELGWRLAEDAVRELAGVHVERSLERAGPYEARTVAPLAPSTVMSFIDPGPDLAPAWYRLVLVHRAGMRSIAGPIEAAEAGRLGATSLLEVSPSAEGGVTIRYAVGSAAGEAELLVFDVRGRLVRTLGRGRLAPGQYLLQWDRRTASGDRVPRGVYFVHLRAADRNSTRKLVLAHQAP
jgi:hypothetical protein